MLMSGGGKLTTQSRRVSASRSPRFQYGHLSHGPEVVEADQAGDVRRGRKEGGDSEGEDKSLRLTSGNARAREQSRPVTARPSLKTTGI